MTELITAGIIIAILGATVLLGWLIAKITDFCVERHYAKLRKKHPKLYEMCTERDALANKRHKEWRARYFDPKTEIDEILKMMPYFTKEKCEEEEKHLEELRKTMEDYQREGDPIKEQIAKLQERIEEYARENNLKNF
jgi:chromosome segregation ATPase